jgi:tetratricopeptide (TPR) repeat protein
MNDQSGSLESLVLKAASAPEGEKQKLYRDLIEPLWNEIKLNPNNPGPYHALNEAYQNLNIPDSAIIVLKEALKLNEKDAYALFQLGTVYGKYKNDFNNSVLYLEKARTVDPKNEDVYINLGIAYSFLQADDKALEMMQKVASINPNNKTNLHNLEFQLRKSGKITEADEVKKRLN